MHTHHVLFTSLFTSRTHPPTRTRTLTIAAIIGEAIGTTEMIIPLAISCMIARTITKVLAGHTVDEFQIHEKDLFFLESDVPAECTLGTCADLVDDRVPTLSLQASPLRVAAVLERNRELGYNAFPVLSESGHLHGMVSRAILAMFLGRYRPGFQGAAEIVN